MNIKDFRKNIFINSQYCTYYIDNKQTVAAGVIRSNGYKFQERFSEEQINLLNRLYRKYTTIMNCAVVLEIILYIYCVLIPYFVQFIQMPYFISIMTFSIPPMVALLLTYVVINKIYENELKQFGTFEIVKFKPNIYNVEPKAFDAYLKTKKKSWIVMLIIMIVFILFAFTPLYAGKLNNKNKYSTVVKLANIYLKFIPVDSEMYAQRAFAQYKLKNFENAKNDFEKANLYSNSDIYDSDILGVEIEKLPFKEANEKLITAMNNAESEEMKTFYEYQRAILLHKNKKYKEALDIYNKLVELYKKDIYDGYSINEVYHYRSQIKELYGDKIGAKADKEMADNICSNCKYDLEFVIVRRP